MKLSFKKAATLTVLGLAFSAYADAFHAPGHDVKIKGWEELNKADVEIPVHNFRTMKDGRLEFIVKEKEVSKFAFMLASSFGYYIEGRKDEHQLCPVVLKTDDDNDVTEIQPGVYRVRLWVQPHMRDAITKAGCIISKTPELSRAPSIFVNG